MVAKTDFLMVDDESSVAEIFKRIAKEEKWSIEHVDTGYKALHFLAEHPPLVIVLDVHLPGLDGFQILEYVRANCPDTEVVVITGLAKIEDSVKALKMGAFGFCLARTRWPPTTTWESATTWVTSSRFMKIGQRFKPHP